MGIMRTLLLYDFSYSEYEELSGLLRENEYVVARCSSYSQLKKIVNSGEIDVVVINDDLEAVCLKSNRSELKVIFMTSLSYIPPRVLQFVDEIVKFPYTKEELTWCVKKLFTVRNCVTVGDIARLNNEKLEFVVNGVRTSVTEYEASLLSYILENRGVMNRALLCRYLSVLSGKTVTDRYLTTLVSRLRSKIRKSSGMDLIKSKRGLGYFCTLY